MTQHNAFSTLGCHGPHAQIKSNPPLVEWNAPPHPLFPALRPPLPPHTRCDEVVKQPLVERLQDVGAAVEGQLRVEQGAADAETLEEQAQLVALGSGGRGSYGRRGKGEER